MVQGHGAPADRATGHQSPRPESNRLPTRYKLAALPVSYKGEKASAQARAVDSASPRTGAFADASCPRRDSNAHCRSPRDRDSYRLVYEDMEPPPGVEPGLRPYGGRAASRARRRGYRDWNRTSVLLFQRQGGMPATHPVLVRKVRFERTSREV
jgi:hypothetical protein